MKIYAILPFFMGVGLVFESPYTLYIRKFTVVRTFKPVPIWPINNHFINHELPYSSEQDEVNLSDKMAGVIAHFVAHNKAVVAMEFDTNGTLLLTADSVGNYFNLFKIMAHPSGSCYSTVHHLYSLYRGETPGSVQDIAFSPDSR